MTKKTKTIEKTFQFNCSVCQKIYQLIETHYLRTDYLKINGCSANCSEQWKKILHDYYQEKVLAYLAQKERENEEEEETEEE